MGVCRSSRSSHRSLCVYIAAICFLLSERRTDSRNPVPLVDGECCHVPCYPRESHLASLSDCCSFFFLVVLKTPAYPAAPRRELCRAHRHKRRLMSHWGVHAVESQSIKVCNPGLANASLPACVA